MNIDNKVLACVDRSPYADHVADHAAWAARRMDAPLELLHVIDRHPEFSDSQDHSGALTPNAQEHLLDKLSNDDELHTRTAREQGRIFLNRLRERALAAGVASVDMRQRHGYLDETLQDQQAGVRLFVLGRRGESVEAPPDGLGSNVERVARALERPLLVVTEQFREPQKILMSFDGSAVTRKGVEKIAASPLLRGLPLQLLMSGKARGDGVRQMEWATSTLSAAGFSVTGDIQPGDTEEVVTKAIVDRGIDLLIMGSYSHSAWRGLVAGSKTTDLLKRATVPTLLLR